MKSRIVIGSVVAGMLALGAAAGTLPKGYTALDYITSSGREFVKTAYVPKAATRIECDVNVMPYQPVARWATVFGTRKDLNHANDITFFSHSESQKANFPSYSQCGVQTAGKTPFTYGRKTHLVCQGNTATWTDDTGAKGSITAPGTARDCLNPLCIFGLNDSPKVGGVRCCTWSRAAMRLHAFRIFEGDKLVGDFVPCRSPKGEAGLYECIGGAFCGNAGEGRLMGSDSSVCTYTAPKADLAFKVYLDGPLGFSLTQGGHEVIARSALGFVFKDEPAMSAGFELVAPPAVTTDAVDEWTPVVANKHGHVRLVYNQAVLPLREASGERRRLDLTVRLYDDGVAFRYTLYGRNRPQERLIMEELTEYRVPQNSFAWVATQRGGRACSQEAEFKKTPLAQMPSDQWCFAPLLVEVDRTHYLAMTSAHLDNYPGFFTAYRDGAIKTRLAPTDAEGAEGVAARFDHRFDTPWRVIFAGDNPGKFIESELIRSLNPPCAIADTSWIKPGMCAWDHWWSGEVKMDMPTIKEYIDFASKQGWPYMLVDWQWYGPFNRAEADITKWSKKINLPELVDYAKARNVRLWLWLYCADANRNDAYVEAFKLYRQWGIAGVKIDFMDRYDREVVNWYRRMTAAAAENHLMINYHGAFAPDGIDRTYPNQVTREGVMGAEYSKFSNDITPHHNVTLCFTRMLAGAMDYTPGAFLNVTPQGFRKGRPTMIKNTRAAELAKFVVYESPLTVFADHPRHVLGQVGADFVAKVPTTWDDTRFLGGCPGEWIALAKRSGKAWYIGVMGGDDAREVTIDLSKLGAGKTMATWSDGTRPNEALTARTTRSGDTLTVKLAPGGGFVAIIE